MCETLYVCRAHFFLSLHSAAGFGASETHAPLRLARERCALEFIHACARGKLLKRYIYI